MGDLVFGVLHNVFPFLKSCILFLFDLFLVHFVHHREHDVLFLMKISITYKKNILIDHLILVLTINNFFKIY